MKKFALLTILAATVTIPVFAGGQFGGRYSNYQVDVSIIELGIDADRASSVGVIGSWESGPLVFRGFVDHDFEANFSLFDFLEIVDYERDRAEVSIGYRITDNLDLEGVARYDSIDVGVGDLFGDDLTASFDGAQIGAGVTFQSSPDAAFGWRLTGRYFVGQVDVEEFDSVDVNTLRLEAAFPIRITDTPWTILPGIEYEQLETDDQFFSEGFLLDIEGNRFFIGLLYEF